jgi:hypothetical protein
MIECSVTLEKQFHDVNIIHVPIFTRMDLDLCSIDVFSKGGRAPDALRLYHLHILLLPWLLKKGLASPSLIFSEICINLFD